MRYGTAQMQAKSQRFDIGLRQRRRRAPSAAYNCQHPRHFQHAHALSPLDADKDVTGKQREIQGDPRPVAPLALRLVEGQIVLNLPHAQVLVHALFMTRSGIDSKPMRRELQIDRGLRDKSARLRNVEFSGFRQPSHSLLGWALSPRGTSFKSIGSPKRNLVSLKVWRRLGAWHPLPANPLGTPKTIAWVAAGRINRKESDVPSRRLTRLLSIALRGISFEMNGLLCI